MLTFLYILFFVSCLVLIVTVLLQPGKTDAGALFTSGVAKAALNPRGTASVLSKLTIVAATVFMLSALLISLPSLNEGTSVLETQGESKSSTPTNTNANANTNANTANANSANANTNANAASPANSNTNAAAEGKEEEKADDKKAEESKADEKPADKKEENK